MRILNLGCGSRTSPHCINIDWSPYLRLKSNRVTAALAPVVLRGKRRERFASLDENILVHDLRRPLPFDDGTVDAIYHSHVLEHLDREYVPRFLQEIRRALRSGGVHRVVVPDLEIRCRTYLGHLDFCVARPELVQEHDRYVSDIIEQLVRREATGTSEQGRARRILERALLGDARRRGETHRWMYDRINLGAVLVQAGFHGVSVVDQKTSAIPGWENIRLDELDDGEEYIAGSLYVEAIK